MKIKVYNENDVKAQYILTNYFGCMKKKVELSYSKYFFSRTKRSTFFLISIITDFKYYDYNDIG